jgi:hypothetical protein
MHLSKQHQYFDQLVGTGEQCRQNFQGFLHQEGPATPSRPWRRPSYCVRVFGFDAASIFGADSVIGSLSATSAAGISPAASSTE